MRGNGGRHRRANPYQGRHRQEEVLRAGRSATTIVLVSIGIGAMAFASGSEPVQLEPAGSTAVTVDLQARQFAQEASRSMMRAAVPAPAPSRTPAARPAPAKAPKRAPKAGRAPATKAAPKATVTKKVTPKVTPKRPALPVPVGGLNQAQMNHAATIVRAGRQMALPRRAYIVAIATVLQESYLRNLANGYYPESLDLANDGVGADHDSVGLFQQRPSAGWGTVLQCMTPAYAATKFYEGLNNVYGWQSMPVAQAAQAVQVSAFPDAYAKHEFLATLIVDALT
jgi:hypothetical protein